MNTPPTTATTAPTRVPAARHRAAHRRPSRWRGWRPGRGLALLCFVTLAATVNAVTYHHPLVPVGFGLYATPVALAISLIDVPATWVHQRGGQPLAFAAILLAAVVSCAVGGAYGAAWAIAYLVAELLGLCTWRLDRLDAHPGLVLPALLFAILAEVGVYVWLLSTTVTLTLAGQLLGIAWGLLAAAVILATVRWRRWARTRDAGGGDA